MPISLSLCGLLTTLVAQAGAPTLVASLIREHDGAAAWEEYGSVLASGGDVDGDGIRDLIVGVPRANQPGLSLNGRVEVISGLSGAVLHVFYGAAAVDHFGNAVAIVGDVDGDGLDDLLVGAKYADPGGNSQGGSAFLFSGATGVLIHRFDGAPSERMGASVVGLEDIDGDGITDFAVAATGALSGAGEVRIYSGGTRLLIRTHSGTTPLANFGAPLTAMGDFDGDGVSDLVISESPGKISAFSSATGALLFEVAGNSGFGTFVGGLEDVNFDGVPDLAVNIAYSTVGVHSVVLSGVDGSTIHSLTNPGSLANPDGPIAGTGDIDGDGVGDLAVTDAYWTQERIGFYSGATGHLLGLLAAPISTVRYGSSIVALDDLNGDGIDELAVGASGTTVGSNSFAGKVFIESVRWVHQSPPVGFAWVWNPNNGHWYTLLANVNWADATALEDQHLLMELATVRDIAEQDWLFQVLMGGSGHAYVGLTDEAQEGNFVWRSGESTPYWSANNYFGVGGVPGYWYFQEPNNLNNEDVVTIGRPGGTGVNGEWNDASGQSLHGAILEWIPPATASTSAVLVTTGSCPGALQAICTGLTPGKKAAVAYGLVGSAPTPAGPCGTVTLDLLQPTLLFVATADSFGAISFNGNAPASACGTVRVQVLDLTTCIASNYVAL